MTDTQMKDVSVHIGTLWPEQMKKLFLSALAKVSESEQAVLLHLAENKIRKINHAIKKK